MNLPSTFTERMKTLLGEEFPIFLASFDQPRYYGLRINTLKWSVQEALEKLPFALQPIPWVKEGFYYSETERPAKHPYYHAGLYYLQEPSAMAPAAVIPIKPGDRVLDLCAAPGGKSTQVAARLAGKGVLVSNDINAERTKALVKNLELFGVKNAIVTNETPQRLAKTFPHYFDKILIDAPCSGEGMFRKNPEMIKSWEEHNVQKCVLMQKDILAEAATMLRTGGYMLYSTCTFAPEENEQQIANFLETHPDFELVKIPPTEGFQQGKQEWSLSNLPLDFSARLWPHQLQGEGHYLALLRKKTGPEQEIKEEKTRVKEKELAVFKEFEQAVFTKPLLEIFPGELALFKGHLYIKPAHLPSLQGLKVIKSGWYAGEMKKNRFEPSQALALGLQIKDVQDVVSFRRQDEELTRYLKGETLHRQGAKGWKLVAVDGFPIGWAKQNQGILKNAYPPGWRQLS